MAKRQTDEIMDNLPENVHVQTARNGVAIPVNADSSIIRELTDDVLRQIGGTGDAFADAMQIAEQLYGEVRSVAEDFGSGFQLTPDKNELVGKKFVLLKWSFTQGDFGVFASAALVTADGKKLIINDGSTGLCEQLRQYSIKTGKFGGYVAPRGLRTSSYATCKGCGQPRSAFDEICTGTLVNGSQCGDASVDRGTGQTYYLDLSV